jgi:hypothetical protein
MRKVVINTCFGGFGLSVAAALRMGLNIRVDVEGNIEWVEGEHDLKRDDPRLVEAVETLGDRASGAFAELKVVEIPDDVEWIIEEYDGAEWVSEKHRTWR